MMALVADLDEEGLKIVQREVDERLEDGDGLKCGREVAAYDRCARAAMEAFASGKTGAGAATEAADADDDAA